MSDSEQKPAKKKATKAAKRPAKKATEKTTKKQADEAVEANKALLESVDDLSKKVSELLGDDISILAGPARVGFYVTIEDAETPAQAVELAGLHLARTGFGGLVAEVVEEDGSVYYIRNGEEITEEQLREELENLG